MKRLFHAFTNQKFIRLCHQYWDQLCQQKYRKALVPMKARISRKKKDEQPNSNWNHLQKKCLLNPQKKVKIKLFVGTNYVTFAHDILKWHKTTFLKFLASMSASLSLSRMSFLRRTLMSRAKSWHVLKTKIVFERALSLQEVIFLPVSIRDLRTCV